MNVVDMARLRTLAETEFADIVVEAWTPDINEMRILLNEGSFVDIWYSLKLASRYSYHWERRSVDGTIYRHDNAPHQRWRTVPTYPKHFHDGSEMNVAASHISEQPDEAVREFLTFIRTKL